jgi:uncharacterized protein YcgI (DUF1989 family)
MTAEAPPEKLELGTARLDLTLQPVSGKAIPVMKGEVLRIQQIEGEQCVDFNCFNLHDYKEQMSAGHMRREGFRMSEGRFIWSNPPRFRPMMQLIHLPPTCSTDLLGPRCAGVLFERALGLMDHPNCQDTLAESIAEYGLTPDDVHDSLNFWMNTQWDHIGWYTTWNTGQAGDHVDLLATMDVLAVPAVCGSGNVFVTSNFAYKPIRLQVFEASSSTSGIAERQWHENSSLKNQRTLDDFVFKDINIEPELRPDLSYVPEFKKWPMRARDIDVVFSDAEYRRMWGYRGTLGDTDDELVRTLFMNWYRANRKLGKRY